MRRSFVRRIGVFGSWISGGTRNCWVYVMLGWWLIVARMIAFLWRQHFVPNEISVVVFSSVVGST